MKTEPSCSFCGKPKQEVAVLVAGPTCYICDQCVDLSFDIVAEHRETAARPWVERLRQAVDDLYATRGAEEQDRRLRAILAEPGADERLRDAGEAARRIIGELREIRREIAAVETSAKEKTDR